MEKKCARNFQINVQYDLDVAEQVSKGDRKASEIYCSCISL